MLNREAGQPLVPDRVARASEESGMPFWQKQQMMHRRLWTVGVDVTASLETLGGSGGCFACSGGSQMPDGQSFNY
jgi:hypothetical protein